MGLFGGTQIETNKRNVVRNVIAWIGFNRTTDSSKIEVIVLDDQKSRELRSTWMGDQKRIPRVVIPLIFFSFPFEGDIKDCRTTPPCVMSLLLFLNYLFLISPCLHSRVYLQCRTIVQINSQTRRSNSSHFS